MSSSNRNSQPFLTRNEAATGDGVSVPCSLSASLHRRDACDKVVLVSHLSKSGIFGIPRVKAHAFRSHLYGLQVHRQELGNFVLIT